MCSEWRVTKNYVDGGYLYAAYRLIDVAKTDHSGNREYATDWMTDKQKATAIAEKLNKAAEVQP